MATILLTLSPLNAMASPPHASSVVTQTGQPASTIDVSLSGAATINLSAPAVLGFTWSNPGGVDLAGATLNVHAPRHAIASAAEVDEWMAGGGASTDALVSMPLPPTNPGVPSSGSISVPADIVATWAPRAVVGLRVELVAAGVVIASGSLVAATTAASNDAGASLALVYPLVAPSLTGGLIPSSDLATLTAPDGALATELDALDGTSVAIAIDPRIIASIRVLGSAAPASAVAWLARLNALQNLTFPLSFGDADLAAQAQAKVPKPLEPLGFRDALDGANFAATSTPTPTPTPGAHEPTASDAELLAWPYTRTDIAWPADGTVGETDLSWLAHAGLSRTILSQENVAPATTAVSAAATIGTNSVVVADGRITAALRSAVGAVDHTAWRQAMTRLDAELALVGASRTRASLLATFDRTDHAGRLGETLRELNSVPSIGLASLTQVLGAAPVARTLISMQVDPTRQLSINRMLKLEQELSRFATALTDPTALTAPVRRSLLALLGVGAAGQPSWANNAIEWMSKHTATVNSVSVVPGSKVNVVSRESGVPTIVQNLSAFPVTVQINVAPSNGRLVVEKRVTVTIDPGSRSNVLVPVAAGVGSGDVTLTISLTSPTGEPIGAPVNLDVNAQPDWEGIGAIVVAGAVLLLFGFGIVRTVRRRRRARDLSSDDASARGVTDAAGAAGAADGGLTTEVHQS